MGTLAMAPPHAAAPARPVRHCVGPFTDFFLVGGASIIACAAVHAIWPLHQLHVGITWTFFYLAFLVNWPHFLISYQILYWNYRRELFTRPRFLWAGVIAPGALIGLLATVALADNGWLAAWMVRAMFLLVGWHYVKQSYGLFVVQGARNGFFLNNTERAVLRGAMYALWALAFLATNVHVSVAHWTGGVGYALLWWLPAWCTPVAYGALIVTAAAALGVLVWKARREGVTPPLNAIVALVAIYVWFIPVLNHNLFNQHMVPFFHSAQYLLIAVLMSTNRARAMASEEGTSPWPPLATYLGATIVLGAFFSTILPNVLDQNVNLGLVDSAPDFWIFAFVWFINVHHYFIDNKIWLRDNAEMRYLR